MTSYLKSKLGFNIIKNNPFKACLNINHTQNFPKDNKINTIKKNRNKILENQKQNKSYITSSKKKSYISLISNESYIDTDIPPNILKKINSSGEF